MVKEIKNKYGVKVGDIFFLNIPCGLTGHIIQFFQVVNLRGKNQVVIREIEFKKVSENEQKEDLVIAQKNKFKEKSDCIKDNKVGAIKLVREFNDGSGIFIDVIPTSWYGYARLWDGEPKIHYICYL